MPLQDIFDILIHRDAFEGANFDANRRNLALFEQQIENNNTQLLSVSIKGIDEVYAAIKLDADRRDFLRPNGLIKNCDGEDNQDRKHHVHKKCDYLVFCRVATKNYILLIEMKSEEAKHIPEKIKSTKAIVAYFIELLNLHYSYDLKQFKQIAILFDKGVNKYVTELEKDNIKYKHQGFKEQDGVTFIQPFLK